MRTRIQALDILANNIANASSKGYKADREVFNIYHAEDAFEPRAEDAEQYPWIRDSWTDFTQGTVEPTGNPFDLALVGDGFLTMRGTSGNIYTRDGSLTISPKGELVGPEGRAVLDTNNSPIRVDPNRPFDIDGTGALKQDGNTVATLKLVEFADRATLRKVGTSYFAPADGSPAPKASTQTQIRQGHMEMSNASPAQASIQLVGMLRQFEMLQRAVEISSQMDEQVVSIATKK
jgi:flagellar basal body rod protein FlgG